jgi:hypothetical protein
MWGGLNRLQGVGLSVLNQAVSGGAKLLERIDGDMEGALEDPYDEGANSDVYDSQDEAAAVDEQGVHDTESQHGDADAEQRPGTEEAGTQKREPFIRNPCRQQAS